MPIVPRGRRHGLRGRRRAPGRGCRPGPGAHDAGPRVGSASLADPRRGGGAHLRGPAARPRERPLLPAGSRAAENSQIGGNIATNAGGPHAFKYGVTGTWVTRLEAVFPPGEILEVGGPFRKDVASFDLKNLMIGSEGTLGIISAAWLSACRPRRAPPVVAFYAAADAGCRAIEGVLGAG